jgi:putative transposase
VNGTRNAVNGTNSLIAGRNRRNGRHVAAIPPISPRNYAKSRRRRAGIALDEGGAVSSTRIVVPGATTAITRRTTLRKAFLAPWHPLVEQSWLYALADAQRVLGFQLHHGVRVVSHHHLSITLGDDNLGEVLRRFHRDVSCAINVLLAHERYDAPRNVFDGRESHCMRLLDAAAQASHLTYEFLNPVAAGLVAQHDHMPGTVLDWGHWKTGGIVVRRPDVYFSDQRPEELRLELSPPPLLMRAFDGDLDGLVHHMRRLSDHGCRALRDARRGRAPLGAQRLVRMHPWNEPRTLAEPGGRLVPTFKVGATGFIARRTRCAAAREVRGFRIAHEQARRARLAGNSAAEFPYGTYAMRRFHRVPVAEPHPEAIVARPGPSLNDVLVTIAEQSARNEAQPPREPTLEQIRAAWTAEAADLAARGELDFVAETPASSPSPTTNTEGEEPSEKRTRREPRRRHRFDPDLDEARPQPCRLIIHRDRRRGRPRKPTGDGPPV